MTETKGVYTVEPTTQTEQAAPVLAAPKKSSTLSLVLMVGAGIGIGMAALFYLKGGSFNDLVPTTGIVSGVSAAQVVVVDAPKLIQATLVAQLVKKEKGFDGSMVGKVVAATVEKYRKEGFIVIAAGNTVGFPASADITPEIARTLGVDLADADLGARMLSGEDAIPD